MSSYLVCKLKGGVHRLRSYLANFTRSSCHEDKFIGAVGHLAFVSILINSQFAPVLPSRQPFVGLSKQMADTMEIPKSRLIEAKQRRQDASKDALLLKNRIALLKAEEDKAWKKIEQTRRRAAELLKLRQDNGRAHAMLKELAMEVERETQASIQLKRELVLSIDSIPKKKEMSMQLTEARRCEALQLKEDKQRWKEIMDRQKRDELIDAIRRKEEIENQKEALRVKKLLHKQDVDKNNRERSLEKIRTEEDQARRHEAEVQEMERQELELIQRLRNTQHLQKQAFEELEAALSGGTTAISKFT